MTLYDKNNQIIDLVNQTHEIIIKQNLVVPKQSILITISGGQDSLCLFFILLHFKNQWKWRFGILYCNHFWQSNTLEINSLIFKLSLIFLIPGYLNLPLKNIFTEQNSRSWRYEQFSRISYFFTYQSIMAGHTGTDRVETILFQLIRGTSTRGLSTLNWFRSLDQNTNNYLTFKKDFLKSSNVFKNSKVFQSFPYTSQIWSDPVLLINFCNHDFFKFQEKFTLFPKKIYKIKVLYIEKDGYVNSDKSSRSKRLKLLINTTILKKCIFQNILAENFSSKILSNLILCRAPEHSRLIIQLKPNFLSHTKLIKVENIYEQLVLIKLKLLYNNFFIKIDKFFQIKNKLLKIYFISRINQVYSLEKKSFFPLLIKQNKFCFVEFSKKNVWKNSYRLKYKNKFTQSELIQKNKFRVISSHFSNKLFETFLASQAKKETPISGFVLESLILKPKSSSIIIKYLKLLHWNKFKKKFLSFTPTNFNSFLIIKNSQMYNKAYSREKASILTSFSQSNFLQYQNQSSIIENNIATRQLEKLFNTNTNKLQKNFTFPKLITVELSLPHFKKIALFKKKKKPLFIFRPLLFLTRFDLTKISKFWNLPIYPDQTNETLIYSRNRIRKQLLPILRFFFNPQVDKLFLQFAEMSNSEQFYLETLSTYLQDEFQNKSASSIQLNCLAMNLLPVAIQRRLLKNFLDQYSIKNVKFFHIEILLKVLNIKKNKLNNFYYEFCNVEKKNNLFSFYTQLSFYTYLLKRQHKKKKVLSLFFFQKDYFTSFSSKSFSNYYLNKNLQNKNQFVSDSLQINQLSYKKTIYKKLRKNFRASSNYTKETQSIFYSLNGIFFKMSNKRFYFFTKGLVKQYKFFFRKILYSKSIESPKSFGVITQTKNENVKISKTLFYFHKGVQHQTKFWHLNQLKCCKLFFYPELGSYIINNKEILIIVNPIFQEK